VWRVRHYYIRVVLVKKYFVSILHICVDNICENKYFAHLCRQYLCTIYISFIYCFLSSGYSVIISVIITLQRPSVCSRYKITDKSFTHHAPVLWNSLPKLRQPSASPSRGTATNFSILTLSSHQFHSELKTFLFEQSFPS